VVGRAAGALGLRAYLVAFEMRCERMGAMSGVLAAVLSMVAIFGVAIALLSGLASELPGTWRGDLDHIWFQIDQFSCHFRVTLWPALTRATFHYDVVAFSVTKAQLNKESAVERVISFLVHFRSRNNGVKHPDPLKL
jgi:hypothetical protein